MAERCPIDRRWAVAALLLLTGGTGLIDAVSYLGFERVFVANMTGNVVFLGFSLSDRSGFSPLPALVAILAFLVGALLGGRCGRYLGQRPRRWLGVAFGAQAAVLAVTAALLGFGAVRPEGDVTLVLIAVLAPCYGLQNSTVRQLGLPGINTTVVTMTLAALASDSPLGEAKRSHTVRRLGSAVTMFLGAAAGALLLRATFAGVIALSAVLVATSAALFLFAPAPERPRT